jgi:AraC-like DNA-binding protein
MGQEGIVLNIIDYLDHNLTEEITIDSIAGKFHFNRFYLMKMFKKVTGITILEYVNHKKIIGSLSDVVNTDDKILKIALNHGFNSQEYYSEMFTKVLGISPSEFRKQAPINPEYLRVGDDDMTRLEQIQSEIKLLEDLRNALLVQPNLTVEDEKKSVFVPVRQSKPMVVKNDKPKVYQYTNNKYAA